MSYRPSKGSRNEMFTTPEDSMPFVHLPMRDDVRSWLPHFRRVNTGPTRWAGLIMGLAVDAAVRDGAGLEEINHAVRGEREGGVAFRAEFTGLGSLADRYSGSVAIRLSSLVVSGRTPGYPGVQLQFMEVRSGVYVPTRATTVVESQSGRDAVRILDLPNPLPADLNTPPEKECSEELNAAADLAALEETVTEEFGRLTVSASVEFGIEFPRLES